VSTSSSNEGADSVIERYCTAVYRYRRGLLYNSTYDSMVQACAVEIVRTIVVQNRKPNSSR